MFQYHQELRVIQASGVYEFQVTTYDHPIRGATPTYVVFDEIERFMEGE